MKCPKCGATGREGLQHFHCDNPLCENAHEAAIQASVSCFEPESEVKAGEDDIVVRMDPNYDPEAYAVVDPPAVTAAGKTESLEEALVRLCPDEKLRPTIYVGACSDTYGVGVFIGRRWLLMDYSFVMRQSPELIYEAVVKTGINGQHPLARAWEVLRQVVPFAKGWGEFCEKKLGPDHAIIMQKTLANQCKYGRLALEFVKERLQ